MAFGVGDRPEIAEMTVSTNPYLGTTRNRLDAGTVEPFVKLAGVATYIMDAPTGPSSDFGAQSPQYPNPSPC